MPKAKKTKIPSLAEVAEALGWVPKPALVRLLESSQRSPRAIVYRAGNMIGEVPCRSIAEAA